MPPAQKPCYLLLLFLLLGTAIPTSNTTSSSRDRATIWKHFLRHSPSGKIPLDADWSHSRRQLQRLLPHRSRFGSTKVAPTNDTQISGDATWAEANALLAFKAANNDPGGLLDTWNLTQQQSNGSLGPDIVCTWPGITCDNATQRVTSIALCQPGGPWLEGNGQSLPPELSDLAHLSSLDLSNCLGLNGAIPPELGRCTRLSRLDLSSNSFSGPIPDNLTTLVNLQYLLLPYNTFSGTIPRGLTALSNLSILSLHHNFFSGDPFPPGIGNLRQLLYYDLSENPVSGPMSSEVSGLQMLQSLRMNGIRMPGPLPSELGLLSGLMVLDLGGCSGIVGGVPEAFSGLLNLTYLHLPFEDFPPLPAQLWANLSQLCVLRLSGVSGSLPVSLGDLGTSPSCQQVPGTRGTAISITNSRLSGGISDALWSGLCNVTRGYLDSQAPVVALNFSSCNLTGTLSLDFTNCFNLMSLDLSVNRLTGSLGEGMSLQSTVLSVLDLHSNLLQGSLPTDLLNALPALYSLNLAQNDLSGPVPFIDCSYAMLATNIQLGGNMFSGNINAALAPSKILSCAYLSAVGLENNQLHGRFPWAILNLKRIAEVCLHGNQLSGPLPPSLGGGSVRALSLASNMFSGSIPVECTDAKYLQELNLSSNLLNGSVPSSLGSLTSLELLDFSGNFLDGSISQSLENLTALTLLSLTNNSLQGPLGALSGMLSLRYLSLAENQLNQSGWPSQGSGWEPLGPLMELSLLQHLDLSSSQVPLDSTPPFLTDLPALTFLNLAGISSLSGPVPPALGDLLALQVLDLQGTNLSGPLPSSLAGLAALSSLNVPSGTSCPSTPCLDPVPPSSRNNSFCALCPDFCASCPTFDPPSMEMVTALLQFQLENGIPGTWSTDELAGVLVEKGQVKQIVMLSPQPHCGRMSLFSVSSLRVFAMSLSRLRLRESNLEGPIPCGLTGLNPLEDLDLACNSFWGPIPACLAQLWNITRLDLSHQRTQGLHGASALGSLTGLRFLSLANAGFSEPFPSLLNQLDQLSFLDLSNNLFSGSFPDGLSRLSQLKNLNLRGLPNMHGLLPAGLASLPLEHLFLDPHQHLCPLATLANCPLAAAPVSLAGAAAKANFVNLSSPFCTQYCPEFCNACSPGPPPPPTHPPLPPGTAAQASTLGPVDQGSPSTSGEFRGSMSRILIPTIAITYFAVFH